MIWNWGLYQIKDDGVHDQCLDQGCYRCNDKYSEPFWEMLNETWVQYAEEYGAEYSPDLAARRPTREHHPTLRLCVRRHVHPVLHHRDVTLRWRTTQGRRSLWGVAESWLR